MWVEGREARGRIGASEGKVESIGGPGGLDGSGVGQGVGGFIVPGEEDAGRGGFPDGVVEFAIDARQICFVCVCEIERSRFAARGEIIGLLEEAEEALRIPKDAILGGFIRGRFLPGFIEECTHFVNGFGRVGNAEDVFVGARIVWPGARPALFLEGEEAAHGGGRGAEHVAAEGIVDGVDIDVRIPEDAEVEVGVERKADAVGRGTDEGASRIVAN